MNRKSLIPGLLMLLSVAYGTASGQQPQTSVEKYDFDEGAGSVVKDSSQSHRVGRLTDVSWLLPGSNEQGACIYFDGEKSRIDLQPASTPTGPLSVSIDVRPSSRYGGVVFCDAGGFWAQFTPQGTLLLVRLSATGFVYATGKTIIPQNQWTHLEFKWDGTVEQIYVNGNLDGQATVAQSAFKSDRRALGCNPFGKGSSYYQGELDNLEIRLLTPSL